MSEHEVLEEMKDKSVGKLNESLLVEGNAKLNFNMLKQSLEEVQFAQAISIGPDFC